MIKICTRTFLALLAMMLLACEPMDDMTITVSSNEGDEPSAEKAAEFIVKAEAQLEELGQEAERMAWVYSNFITEDTERLTALANKKYTSKQVELAIESAQFNDVSGIDGDTRRKLNILRSGIVIPAPQDTAKTAEQSEIGAKMGGMYGKGEYCYANGECLDLGHLRHNGRIARPGGFARGLEWLAQDFTTDEKPVRPPGRACQ